mmetsp:Transcript_32912/g.99121  ORF Transcript_32912/g.99121 Transcript_32912/m.99121 type:complete len:231 (+) Transcript_32912:494-1186(+)
MSVSRRPNGATARGGRRSPSTGPSQRPVPQAELGLGRRSWTALGRDATTSPQPNLRDASKTGFPAREFESDLSSASHNRDNRRPLALPPGSLARRPPPRRAQSTAGRLPTPRRAPHSVAQAYRRTTTTFDGRDRRPQKQARNRRRDRRRRLVAHYRTTRRIEPMLSEQPVKDAPPAGPAPVNDECPCFQTLCCENVECCQPICRQLDGSWCCVVCVGCGSCLVWIGSIFM